MKCPNCESINSESLLLDSNLNAIKCNDCEGIWIPSNNYFKYIESNKPDLSILNPTDMQKVFSEKDSETGKKCPDCGKQVVARKAGFGAEFKVDRCDHCFGIWLDKNEWELLKTKNLNTAIYYMFTSTWEMKVRSQTEFTLKLEAIKKNFSIDQSSKIVDFLEWLEQQENKKELISYINS